MEQAGTGLRAPRGAAGRPALFAVDEDAAALDRLEQELLRRYERDYRIVCVRSAAEALSALEEMRRAGDGVALVLVEVGLAEGTDLFARARSLHPHAKRALLVEWGAWADRETTKAIRNAMALGQCEYYVLKPWRSPDEFFHRTISEFLHEWSRATSADPQEVEVVARQWSPRAHELRSLFAHNGVPSAFHPSDSPGGRRLLHEIGQEGAEKPVVFMRGKPALVDPSNTEVIEAYGLGTELEERDFDLIVVGAGPAGLSASVYASSEGLRTLALEGESIGGQAGSSSHIRNYLGFARGVAGAELTQRAYQQAWVFGTTFILMRTVTALRTADERQVITLSDGSEATARAVVLATGVSYRRLGIPALEALAGAGVFYGASVSEAQALEDQDVFIVGGGNSAGQAARHLARYARQVSLLVRGPSLAASMSRYLTDLLDASGNIDVRLSTEVIGGGGEGRLEHLELRDRTSGATETVPAAALFIMIGAQPHTSWLPREVVRDRWGYVFTGLEAARERRDAGDPLTWQPFLLETSAPWVFAIGDVRHGSVKRVASAVGEGSVAIQHLHRCLAERTGRPPGGRRESAGRALPTA